MEMHSQSPKTGDKACKLKLLFSYAQSVNSQTIIRKQQLIKHSLLQGIDILCCLLRTDCGDSVRPADCTKE